MDYQPPSGTPGGFNMDGKEPRAGKPLNPILVPAVAAVIAGAIAPIIWVGLYWLGLQANPVPKPPVGWWAIYPSGPLIGLFVGLVTRKANRTNISRVALIAALMAIGACIVGYCAVDQSLITWKFGGEIVQPTIGDSLKRLFGNVQIIVLVALSGYIAYTLAYRPQYILVRADQVQPPRS